jgi:hypothetical protein
MQILLEEYNAWEIVSGNEDKIVALTVSVQYWEKRETKAKVLLIIYVKDIMIPYVRECKTSSEIWETLKGLYETMNTNRVIYFKSKVLSIKMEENENIIDYLSRIKYLKGNLGNIGEEVSSSDVVTKTLNDMLHKYQVFITSQEKKTFI